MAVIRKTKSISNPGTTFKVATLNAFLEDLPESADIRVTLIPRDRPFDSEHITLIASWGDES